MYRAPPANRCPKKKKKTVDPATKTSDTGEAMVPPSGSTALATDKGSLAGGTPKASGLDDAGTVIVCLTREVEGAGTSPFDKFPLGQCPW